MNPTSPAVGVSSLGGWNGFRLSLLAGVQPAYVWPSQEQTDLSVFARICDRVGDSGLRMSYVHVHGPRIKEAEAWRQAGLDLDPCVSEIRYRCLRSVR